MSPEGKFEVGADRKRRGVGLVLQLQGEWSKGLPAGRLASPLAHRNSTKKKQICWEKAPARGQGHKSHGGQQAGTSGEGVSEQWGTAEFAERRGTTARPPGGAEKQTVPAGPGKQSLHKVFW